MSKNLSCMYCVYIGLLNFQEKNSDIVIPISKHESASINAHNPARTSPIKAPFSTCTATDALASEAAFMENIGLYLTPKPLLQTPRPPLSIAGLISPKPHNEKQSNIVDSQCNQSSNIYPGTSQWEEDLVLEWAYNEQAELNSSNQNSNRPKEMHSTPESKISQRSQYSLLSYLPNKSKTTYLSSVNSNLSTSFTSQAEGSDIPTIRTELVTIHELNHAASNRIASTASHNSNILIDNIHHNSVEMRKHDDLAMENLANEIRKENESLNIPSQSEFMKQIELLNTNDRLSEIESRDTLMSPVTPSKLKLWNPERENTTNIGFQSQTSDEIWNDVLDTSVMESGRL